MSKFSLWIIWTLSVSMTDYHQSKKCHFIILVLNSEYCGRNRAGKRLLVPRDIKSRDIGYVRYTVRCLPRERISAAFAISMLMNNNKYKHIFCVFATLYLQWNRLLTYVEMFKLSPFLQLFTLPSSKPNMNFLHRPLVQLSVVMQTFWQTPHICTTVLSSVNTARKPLWEYRSIFMNGNVRMLRIVWDATCKGSANL